jgi:hypothetical protein
MMENLVLEHAERADSDGTSQIDEIAGVTPASMTPPLPVFF